MDSNTSGFIFPEFPEPVLLAPEHAWTARFMSYDQRMEECYYCVTTLKNRVKLKNFCVQVPVYWMAGDMTFEEMINRIQNEIHSLAIRGKANTSYTGSVADFLKGMPKCE